MPIRNGLESGPENTFENIIELEIIVFTRKMTFDMKRYYLNNVHCKKNRRIINPTKGFIILQFYFQGRLNRNSIVTVTDRYCPRMSVVEAND